MSDVLHRATQKLGRSLQTAAIKANKRQIMPKNVFLITNKKCGLATVIQLYLLNVFNQFN